MLALRSSVLVLFSALSFAACTKAPTVAFENATSSQLVLRASVDDWFNVSECRTGKTKGALNLHGTYEVEAGQQLCMRAKPSKSDMPAAERISRMVVLREAQRCLTLNRDEIQANIRRSGGFKTFVITEELCPVASTQAADE